MNGEAVSVQAAVAIPIGQIILYVLIAVMVGYMVYLFLTVPSYPKKAEGFFGGVARGSGHPDCSRNLDASARVLDTIGGRLSQMGAKANSSTDTAADYRELQLILSKLGCLKKDIMSPSGIVEATRYQAYETAHDREPVAEVAATCLNRTIPARDLDIVFATWRDRGNILLRRLGVAVHLNEVEMVQVEKDFKTSWNDVYDVAKGRCIKTVDEGAGLGSGPAPVTPEGVSNLRAYDGYYSGWTGQI